MKLENILMTLKEPLIAFITFSCLLAQPLLANPHSSDDWIKLLQTRKCSECDLSDADLVRANLRDANLQRASLQRANLNGAQLDGADLRGADLRFTNLNRASLKGANLIGASLYGTDLRNADLSGAKLTPNSLLTSHWDGAQGIKISIHSHANLLNSGVEAASIGRWQVAEELFGLAIQKKPDATLSWVARGIARAKLMKDDQGSADFEYAASLFDQSGQKQWADQLRLAASNISRRRHKQDLPEKTNGWGGTFLDGLIGTAGIIAPIAMKALAPMGIGF